MRQKIDDFYTFGQDLLFRLQMRLPFWRYSTYCFLQRLKKHRGTLLIFLLGLMWQCWRRVLIIGIKTKGWVRKKEETTNQPKLRRVK